MQSYPNPNPHVNPPPRPRRKKYIWILVAGIGCLLIGLLLWGAISIGQKFGNKMEERFDLIEEQWAISDSINAKKTDSLYAVILAVDSVDSSYVNIQSKVEQLRNRTKVITDFFTLARDSFRSSLPDSTAITMLNNKLSRDYFISSGRALKLKLALESYESAVLEDLPEDLRKDTISLFMRTKMMETLAPSPLKKLYSWENQNFNQPPTAVFFNFKILLGEIEMFERTILEKYTTIPPVTVIAPDTTGI